MSPRLMRVLLLAGAVALLEAATRAGIIPTIVLSPPSQIFGEIASLAWSGELWPNLARTMLETVAAFSAAALIGVPLGLLLWRVPYLARVLEPYLASLYAMPLVFFYPLLLALLGLGPAPIVAVAAAMSLVPITLNTRVGLSEVREVYRKLGRALRASRWRTFRQILLPAAAPYLFTGLRMAFIYAYIGAMGMEFVISELGLGFMVRYDYNAFATTGMYAYIVVGLVLAAAINASLERAETAIRSRSIP